VVDPSNDNKDAGDEFPPEYFGTDSGAPFAPELVVYNPDRDREHVRGLIAGGLLALVFLMVGGAFVMVAWGGKEQLEAAEKILGIVWGPIVALVSAATGFYFGAQSSTRT
jgi:hypothetical protein